MHMQSIKKRERLSARGNWGLLKHSNLRNGVTLEAGLMLSQYLLVKLPSETITSLHVNRKLEKAF